MVLESGLFVNPENGYVGIGTTTPGSNLDVIGNVRVDGHIAPKTSVTYDLGTSNYRFRDLYLSGSTINLGGTALSVSSSGDLQIADATSVGVGSTVVLRRIVVNEIQIGSADESGSALRITKDDTGNNIKVVAVDDNNNTATAASAIDGISTSNGFIGIGLTNPKSGLSVYSNIAIGSNYASKFSAPSNSLIVEGAVGIGVTNPGGVYVLEVAGGQARFGSTINVPAIERDTLGSIDIGTTGKTNTINIGTGAVDGGQTKFINIGTGAGPTEITIGSSGDKVYIAGDTTYVQTSNMQVDSNVIILNKGGRTSLGAGLLINGNENDSNAFMRVSTSDGSNFVFKAPDSTTTVTMRPNPTVDDTLVLMNSNVSISSTPFSIVQRDANRAINVDQLNVSNVIALTNIGIGLTNPGSRLAVSSNVSIGSSYATLSAPSNSLIVEEAIGIGKTNPVYPLDVIGNINFTGGLFSNGNPYIASQFTTVSTSNVFILGSNIGIGLTNPGSRLAVDSNVSIGSSYATLSAPSNSLIVEEAIGIGKTNPTSALDVVGNINFTGGLFSNGNPYIASQFTTVSTSNVFILGSNIGIGLTNPGSHLAVSSNMSIGYAFASNAAPSNSLIVQEAIGIGKTNPTLALDVIGDIRFTGNLYKNDDLFVSSGGGGVGGFTAVPTALYNLDCNIGIGTTSPNSKLHVQGDLTLSGTLVSADNNAIWVAEQFDYIIGTAPVYSFDNGITAATLAYNSSKRNSKYLYIGNEVTYSFIVESTVTSPPSTEGDYYLNLETNLPLSSSVYTTEQVIGDLWLTISNAQVSSTFKAYAKAVPGKTNAVLIRYLNGTSDRSLGSIEAGSTINLQGAINYVTPTSTAGTIPVLKTYQPASLRQDNTGSNLYVRGNLSLTGGLYFDDSNALWTSERFDFVEGVAPIFVWDNGVSASVSYNSSQQLARYLYVGNEVTYNFTLGGTVATKPTNDEDFYLKLETSLPVDTVAMTKSGLGSIIGDLWLRITNASTSTTTVFKAFARVDSTNNSRVVIKYLNGTTEKSLGSISSGNEILLQGSVNYKSTVSTTDTTPVLKTYLPAGFRQDEQGKVTLNAGLAVPRGRFDIVETSNDASALVIDHRGTERTQSIVQVLNNGSPVFVVGSNSRIGIGTTAPISALDVVGDLNFTGSLLANGSPYIGSQFTTRSNNVFITGSNVGIGSSAPQSLFHVNGNALVTRSTFSSTAAATAVSTWSPRSTSGFDKSWRSVCWAPELSLFVAVSSSASGGNNVMTSSNGIDWTSRSTSGIDRQWVSVCWAPELSLFVAVSSSASGNNNVMSSSNGIDWTSRSTSGIDKAWSSVCWAPELSLFVAVSSSASGGNNVMTSSNGINWISRSTSGFDRSWSSVCWAPELSLFVAIGNNPIADNIMTSSDGINWTTRSIPGVYGCLSICWSPELSLFVTVRGTGGADANNNIMTSSNGIDWTTRSSGVPNIWRSVCWSPELSLFVVFGSNTVDGIITSSNGINWVSRSLSGIGKTWRSVCWAPELLLFVAVSDSATGGNNAITSTPAIPDGIPKSVFHTDFSTSVIGSYSNYSSRLAVGTNNYWAASNYIYLRNPNNNSNTIQFNTQTGGITALGDIDFRGTLKYQGNPYVGSQFTTLSTSNVTIVGSNVGIGLTNPGSRLAVNSNVSIGSTYSLLSAPSNSLIVQEAIGIGKTNPTTALDVVGTTRTDSLVTSSLQADTNGILLIGTSSAATQIDIGTSTTTQIINIGTGDGTTTINLGAANDTVNIAGTLTYIQTTNLQVTDQMIVVNSNGVTANGAGIGINLNGNDTAGYFRVSSTDNALLEFKAPMATNNITIRQNTSANDTVVLMSSNVSTANNAWSIVQRDGDNSINVGKVNTTNVQVSGDVQLSNLTVVNTIGTSNLNLKDTLRLSDGSFNKTGHEHTNGSLYINGGANTGDNYWVASNNIYFRYGTTANTALSANRFRFDVSNGNIVAFNNITAFDTTLASDKRLKTEINDLSNGLDFVSLLRPVTFRWNSNNVNGGRAGKEDIGFIAQDVEALQPALVNEFPDINDEKEIYKSVNYAKLAPYLVKCVKELKAENDLLKKNVSELTQRVLALEDSSFQ
jgi:hypothetical protein